MKVERMVDIGVTYVNIHPTDKTRLNTFLRYELNLRNHQGIADIYAFIFENLSKPEWYIVQYYGNEFIIQRLGK